MQAARLINDIVIGEETDVGPDGSYVSLAPTSAPCGRGSTRQFEKFRSLVLVGVPVEVALQRIGAPPMCKSLSRIRWRSPIRLTEVLAAFLRPRRHHSEMFRRLRHAL
jgi:hypothetical protein